MFAFVFPGQGSQLKGMGESLLIDYPEVNKTLDQISNFCTIDIRKLCLEDPDSNLKESVHSALAVFSISAIIFEVLEKNYVRPHVYAGYSVGYYSALYASGFITLKTACEILIFRAKLLKDSAKENPSGMIGIIGLNKNKIKNIIKDFNQVYIANENSPVNFTLSYQLEIKNELINSLEQANAMKIVEIPVEGGWHSPFMKNAAGIFSDYISKVKFLKSNRMIIDNFTAKRVEKISEFPSLLTKHIYHPVKWEKCIHTLINYGCTEFIEVGYGDQLSKFIKYTNRKMNIHLTGDSPFLQQAIKEYRAEDKFKV